MSSRFLTSFLTSLISVSALAGVIAVMPVAGQTPISGTKAPAVKTGPAANPAKTWTPPKTPWGDPDLQGVWPSTHMIGTPLERPENFGTRAFLTDEEFAERETRAKQQAENENAEFETVKRVRVGAGWVDLGRPNRQASLIVDPPPGRIPALTPEAQNLAAVRAEARKGRGPSDSWEDRTLWERCITQGVIGAVLPAGYNEGNQIIQCPGYVVFRNEMIHEARIIPLDGRPHVGPNIRLWMGDSRGHWQGNTLVVETTNFTDKVGIGSGGGTLNSESMRLVEHFTRVDADTLNYAVAIEDPKTWTKPWTIAFSFKREADYQQIYEYACHEGNLSMADTLSGARADEKRATEEAPRKESK